MGLRQNVQNVTHDAGVDIIYRPLRIFDEGLSVDLMLRIPDLGRRRRHQEALSKANNHNEAGNRNASSRAEFTIRSAICISITILNQEGIVYGSRWFYLSSKLLA
jgi:hypothetical protein